MRIDWHTLPPSGAATAGYQRWSICGDKLSALRVRREPGAAGGIQPHWHDNEQIIVITEGELHIVIDGKATHAHAGDLVFFPSGSRHAVVGTGPEGSTYYELFAPARPDQLPGWVGASPLRYD